MDTITMSKVDFGQQLQQHGYRIPYTTRPLIRQKETLTIKHAFVCSNISKSYPHWLTSSEGEPYDNQRLPSGYLSTLNKPMSPMGTSKSAWLLAALTQLFLIGIMFYCQTNGCRVSYGLAIYVNLITSFR